jgi:hypothetical protein
LNTFFDHIVAGPILWSAPGGNHGAQGQENSRAALGCPLVITKGDVRVVPHQNWRGQFAQSTYGLRPAVGRKRGTTARTSGHVNTISWSDADMALNSNRSRLLLVVASAWQMASCGSRPSHDGNSLSSEACPLSTAPADSTHVVQAKFSPIELRLPAGSFHTREFADEFERGEAWIGSTELVVSYAVRAEPIKMRDVSRDDQNVVNCSERINGREAVIGMLYSEATTVPGQRVVAIWTLAQGETLVLNAFHPDSARRGDLLNIVRSVRFTN